MGKHEGRHVLSLSLIILLSIIIITFHHFYITKVLDEGTSIGQRMTSLMSFQQTTLMHLFQKPRQLDNHSIKTCVNNRALFC